MTGNLKYPGLVIFILILGSSSIHAQDYSELKTFLNEQYVPVGNISMNEGQVLIEYYISPFYNQKNIMDDIFYILGNAAKKFPNSSTIRIECFAGDKILYYFETNTNYILDYINEKLNDKEILSKIEIKEFTFNETALAINGSRSPETSNGSQSPKEEWNINATETNPYHGCQSPTFTPMSKNDENGFVSYNYGDIPFKAEKVTISPSFYVSANQPKDEFGLEGYSAKAIHILVHSGNSLSVPDNVRVGLINAYYKDGTFESLDLKMGVNIAEWAYDRPEVQTDLRHSKVKPAYSWSTTLSSASQYSGHEFYVRLDTNPNKPLDHLELIIDPSGQDYNPPSYPSRLIAVAISAITLERAGCDTGILEQQR
jgi:hypothetical protein